MDIFSGISNYYFRVRYSIVYDVIVRKHCQNWFLLMVISWKRVLGLISLICKQFAMKFPLVRCLAQVVTGFIDYKVRHYFFISVFHCAATVKFDEALRISVEMNVLGTQRLVALCHMMKNLLVRFVVLVL